jgi:hypothetical protein
LLTDTEANCLLSTLLPLQEKSLSIPNLWSIIAPKSNRTPALSFYILRAGMNSLNPGLTKNLTKRAPDEWGLKRMDLLKNIFVQNLPVGHPYQ